MLFYLGYGLFTIMILLIAMVCWYYLSQHMFKIECYFKTKQYNSILDVGKYKQYVTKFIFYIKDYRKHKRFRDWMRKHGGL